MRKKIFLILIISILGYVTIFAQEVGINLSTTKLNQAEIINFEQYKSNIFKNDNILYVVNFWATWCKPCVEELPEFIALNEKYKLDQNFKMLLVSLDRAEDVKTLVNPFIIRKNIISKVYLLDDVKRMNEWIPAIDSEWSGAIPATVLYKNGIKLEFIEKKIEKSDLEKLINKHL